MWKQMKSMAALWWSSTTLRPAYTGVCVWPSLPVVTSCDGASDLISRAVESIHLRYVGMFFIPRGSLASSQIIIGLPASFGTRKLMYALYAATALAFV